MKRTFIRCVWGSYSTNEDLKNEAAKIWKGTDKLARRSKIDTDIELIRQNKFNEPFVVYVYGKDNYEKIKSLGLDCVLVDENPAPFDQIRYVYRHKLELIKYAMEVDGYDEIVYLDWDCRPQKKLPNNFWDEFQKKRPIQACLQQYRRKKCLWRSDDIRKVSNGGFVYLRDKTIPSKVIEIWKTMPQDNDEPAWTKYIDDDMGGWKGQDEFIKNYEAPFCNLHRMSPIPPEILKAKDICFIHFQG